MDQPTIFLLHLKRYRIPGNHLVGSDSAPIGTVWQPRIRPTGSIVHSSAGLGPAIRHAIPRVELCRIEFLFTHMLVPRVGFL